MVEALETSGDVTSASVRDAFFAVAREQFVPEIAERLGLDAVYRPDVALPIATDASGAPISASSAPRIMAPMLEALELRPGLRILEIGAGTGYNAALLKHLVGDQGKVTTVDVEPAFAQRARRALRAAGYSCHVVTGDGRQTHLPGAPFDRIVVTASSVGVPPAWHDQLVDGGLLELPLRLTAKSVTQVITTFRREGASLHSTKVLAGGFMPLREEAGASSPSSPSLRVIGPRLPMTMLSGPGVASLSPAGNQRALTALLARRRSLRRLPSGEASALMVLVALTNEARSVLCALGDRFGVGLVARDGSGVAAVTRAVGQPGSIDLWGGDHAGTLLGASVAEWEALGNPTLDDLHVAVQFGSSRPRRQWRVLKWGDASASLNWLRPS
jgi:protein-L-isoaspartate(D-aspartate) O-methyltransferase